MIPVNALRALALYLSLEGAQAMPQFTKNIPEDEAAALASIVEDEPGNDLQRRTPLSPAYTLYQAALPIPPVKQPLLYVFPIAHISLLFMWHITDLPCL